MFRLLLALLLLIGTIGHAQYENEPSKAYPYGKPHPDAPEAVKDFHPLIGECQCRSVSRIDQNTWGDTIPMTWRWKYIMNGMGVQDENLKADGKHSGSIRQYIADSLKWYVHYYSSSFPSPSLPTWEGNKKEDGNIVLYRAQKSPNGMDGFYKIVFSNLSEQGYDWEGAWVNPDESIVYPTWRIFCRRPE